jgi:hypothetical protein
MNPIVVIATHGRLEITSYNIKSLLRQSVVPKIVLVVSTLQEKFEYQKAFPDVVLVVSPNIPLGNKWQAGVDIAYEMKSNPLIILGSDDILGDGYVERVCALVRRGHDFIGLYQWFVHYQGKAYFLKYLAKQPLGGARAYSFKLLENLDGKLFDTKLNRHLDDYAIKKCKELSIPCKTDDQLTVHAVKGNWPVLNPLNLNHPNVKLISEHKTSDFFPDLVY